MLGVNGGNAGTQRRQVVVYADLSSSLRNQSRDYGGLTKERDSLGRAGCVVWVVDIQDWVQ